MPPTDSAKDRQCDMYTLRSKLNVDIYKYAIGEVESKTSYLFQGDLSTGHRGHGKVIDNGESPDYFPTMYEAVQTITITQLLKNSITQGYYIVVVILLFLDRLLIFTKFQGGANPETVD